MVFKPDLSPQVKSMELPLEQKVRQKVQAVIARYPYHNLLGPEFLSKIEDIVSGAYVSSEKKPKTKLIFNDYHGEIRIDGQKIKLTEGEITAALEWGIEFELDQASFLSERAPKGQKIYENYTIATREKQALDVLNEFILKNEIEDNPRGTNRKASYEATRLTEQRPFKERSPGIQAEQMVNALLRQICIDNPGLHIQIESTNHYEDVTQGIDMILWVTHTEISTGVKTIEGKPEVRKVQFTTSKTERIIEEKIARAAKDLLVVIMPGLEIKQAIKVWEESGDKLFGPEKYFTKETKAAIVAKIQEVLGLKTS